MSLKIENFQFGELPAVKLTTDLGSVSYTPYGAHILSFTPAGQKDLLWLSEKSCKTPGKAIRGGIPVCWPWFGAAGKPNHGIARISDWQSSEPCIEPDGSVTVLFDLQSEEYGVNASLKMNAGTSLKLFLTTTNVSGKPLVLSEALHTYFNIGDIAETFVDGLSGCEYTDTVNHTEGKQDGEIAFSCETDRFFYPGDGLITIRDNGNNRKIGVARFGSASAVVWNPWIDKSRRMPDFGDEEYHGMLCVEAANVGKDIRTLPDGKKHTIGTEIFILPS